MRSFLFENIFQENLLLKENPEEMHHLEGKGGVEVGIEIANRHVVHEQKFPNPTQRALPYKPTRKINLA